MTFARSLKAALLSSVCLLPLQALAQSSDNPFDVGDKPPEAAGAGPAAQPPNWISVGGQYDSGRANYLNRFNGATGQGFYGLGDFHLGGGDAWDSGGTHYWSMDGKDLGLDSRSFNAKIGQQGTWGLQFSYQGIPYYSSTGFNSVWTGNGSLVPGIPYGGLTLNNWPSSPQYPALTTVTPNFINNRASLPVAAIWFPIPSPSLSSSLYQYDLGTRRDVFTGVGTYKWNDWTITGSWRHEHKTGYLANSLEIGGTVGLTANGTGANKNGSPSATTVTGLTSGLGYFAQPIDYDTDRYDITAAYATQRYQVQLGYMFSNFTDNLTEFNALNPFAVGALSGSGFSGTGTTAAGISAPYALPPSNSAHQVRLMMGYNATPTTRVNANFAYGVQLQNASYVAGTGDPAVNPSLPRSSFDGVVQTLFGNVALVSQPMPKVDVRISYTIDERNNQSPSNAYPVDTRSGAATNGGGDCKFGTGLCVNLPYSYQHQTIAAEVGYRILPQTKLTLSDTFETTYRSFANTSFVTTNTLTLKARSQLADTVFGAISVSHQDRNANSYANGNTWYLMTNGGVNADPSGFLMYFEASRKHDEAKITLDYSPVNSFNATVMAKLSNDTYPGTVYGLRNNFNFQFGPDVAWDITPNLKTHAYYTLQQVFFEQGELYSSAGNGTCATCTGYYVPWTNKTTDMVHTFGLSADWQAIPDVLKIAFAYNFAYGDTAYALGDGMAVIGGGQTSQTTNAALNLQQLPDVTSMLNMVSIRGEYTFKPNWTMIFGYAYERFTYKDWINGTATNQYANALLPGTLNPNESIHIFGAGMRVRF
jgi:MtrB/PioB family decaheme-associated outer membrane protein